MPNWCYTNITIAHENETKVGELERLIEEWTSKNYMENGFGHKWLGNIVLGSGIGTVDKDKATDVRCRGTICDYYRNGSELTINTETAWSPMLGMWVKLVEKYLPGAELIYNAEETGNGVQCTNDPALKDRYVIDCYGDENIESDWEASEKTVIEILQELLCTTETDMEKLLQMFDESEYSENMSIKKWDFDDIDVWD